MACNLTDDHCSWAEAVKARGRCEYEVTFDENDPEHLYNTCQKHPGHESFIPINHLTKETLPPDYGTDELVTLIRCLASLTTRVSVHEVSPERPQRWPSCDISYPCHEKSSSQQPFSRVGTGFIESARKMFAPVQGKCPCPECIVSGNPSDDWWEIRVNTATHLVFDEIEAASTIVDCFYDSDDPGLSCRLQGVGVCGNPHRILNDRSVLVCVTHDVDFGLLVQQLIPGPRRIQDRWSRRTESFFRNHTLIVSHPHGIATKAVTIGRTRFVTVPLSPKYPAGRHLPFPSGMSYRLPVPSSSSSMQLTRDGDLNVRLHQPHTIDVASLGTSLTHHSANNPTHIQELSLPSNMTFVLPPGANFVRKLSLDKSDSFVFPQGTRYFLEDGRELALPPETEFMGWPLEDMVISISYSAATCFGSSGANVFTLEPRRLQQQPYRCRSLGTFIHCQSASPKENSSGYSLFVIPPPNDLVTTAHLNTILRAKA